MLKLRQRLAIILVYMIFAVLLNSVGTVILQSILSFGVSKPQGSILEACKDLSIAVVSFTAASFLPRFGYRKTLVLALVIVALACFAMPLVPAFATTELLFLATGVSFALVKVAVYALIGLIAPEPSDHAGLTGQVEGFFMVGVLSGAWIFSAFIDPAHPQNLVWLRVYWLLGGVSLGAALLWAFTPTPQSAARTTPGQSTLAQIRFLLPELLKSPQLAPFLAAILLYVLVEQSLGTWLPTYNREVLHLPVAFSVQAGGLLAAGIAFSRLASGMVLKRVGFAPFLLGAAALTALVVVISLLAPPTTFAGEAGWRHAPWQAFILPLAGLFLGPIYPTLNSRLLSALPEQRQAAMTGLIIAFSAIGGTFGSFLTGQIFSHLGGRSAFALVLMPLGLLAFSIARFARKLKA